LETFGQFSALTGPQSPVAIFECPDFLCHSLRCGECKRENGTAAHLQGAPWRFAPAPATESG